MWQEQQYIYLLKRASADVRRYFSEQYPTLHLFVSPSHLISGFIIPALLWSRIIYLPPTLHFDYHLQERVSNDFILLASFVGHDFLSNLLTCMSAVLGWSGYSLCIRKIYLLGALSRVRLIHIFNVLPEGYLNETGTINTRRLQVILDKMGHRGWDIQEGICRFELVRRKVHGKWSKLGEYSIACDSLISS
jgi:hypothetical protein